MSVMESEGNINRHPFDMPLCVSIIASSLTTDHCLQPSVYRISVQVEKIVTQVLEFDRHES